MVVAHLTVISWFRLLFGFCFPKDGKRILMASLDVNRPAAMEQLLESIRIDRTWNDEAARVQLLDFFTSIGAANPDVMKARRKLSTLLFS